MRLLEVHDLCRQRHFFQLSCFSISKLSSSLVSKITCDDGLQFVQDRAASSKFKPCISFAYRESRTVCDYLSALFCRVTPEQVVRCTRAKAHNNWYGDVRPSLSGTGEPGTMRALLEVAISRLPRRLSSAKFVVLSSTSRNDVRRSHTESAVVLLPDSEAKSSKHTHRPETTHRTSRRRHMSL